MDNIYTANSEIGRIKENVYDDIQAGRHTDEIADEISHAIADLSEIIIKHIAYETCDTELTLNSELGEIRAMIEKWAQNEAEERFDKECEEAEREYQAYLAEC